MYLIVIPPVFFFFFLFSHFDAKLWLFFVMLTSEIPILLSHLIAFYILDINDWENFEIYFVINA